MYSESTAAALAAAVRNRIVSATELAMAALARIAEGEPKVHAFNQVTPEMAIETAERIDAAIAAGEKVGPLAGVPVAFKDNMNLIGTRTTCSSKILENYESVYNATAVARMLDAGVVPLGKLNMDEFAFGSSGESSHTGPARNPWDLTRIPGGSSAGSAAAVAAGFTPLTLGSDTGGSIRQPGAMTGTVALKPTYGRVSRYGLVAFASSLDQIGPISRTVEDSALALSVIAGKDPMDATSHDAEVEDFVAAARDADVSGMRIGVVRDAFEAEGLQPEVREAFEDAVKRFEAIGAKVDEVSLPMSQNAIAAYYVIAPAEASSNLARFDGIRYGHRVSDAEDVIDLYLRSRAEGFGPESKRRIMLGTYALSAGYYDAYYAQAQRARTLIAREFGEAFERFDVLLTPTSPQVAWRFGEKSDPLTMYLSDVFTIPVNLAGNAAINVPVGFSKHGGDKLPIGLQIIGDYFAEAKLFRAAAALELEMALDLKSPIAEAADSDDTPPDAQGMLGYFTS
ncbi:MAG: Asp-tRNA(Asn)/Glu-tRNA(Gln) amidotransferase subunit GatA [Coriobacteriales bacterium]|nr:Asp-tRNA(Asn)/Glu-tRNA(Gln) amidotransferase subunit GatA [Coriobacteriales bacterium]